MVETEGLANEVPPPWRSLMVKLGAEQERESWPEMRLSISFTARIQVKTARVAQDLARAESAAFIVPSRQILKLGSNDFAIADRLTLLSPHEMKWSSVLSICPQLAMTSIAMAAITARNEIVCRIVVPFVGLETCRSKQNRIESGCVKKFYDGLSLIQNFYPSYILMNDFALFIIQDFR